MITTINYSKIKFALKPISIKESLKDIKPINWSNAVISGEKKVIISKI